MQILILFFVLQCVSLGMSIYGLIKRRDYIVYGGLALLNTFQMGFDLYGGNPVILIALHIVLMLLCAIITYRSWKKHAKKGAALQ